jgi:hypothetical protein
MLGEELEDVLVDLARPNAGQTILKAVKTALSFVRLDINATGGLALGIDLSKIEGSNAATGNTQGDLQRLIRDLSAACEKNNTGVALFFDEAQDMSTADLNAINALVHRANQEQYRLIAVVAGLPALPSRLAESTSYAERLYSFSMLGALDDSAALTALTEPSKAKGVLWEKAAADEVVRSTAGYSYFIQEYGSAAWDCAETSPISLHDMNETKRIAVKNLDTGFFRSRWDRASDAQKEYMRAMSFDGDSPSSTGELAARLRIPASKLAPRRAELIAKGLIYSPKHGAVAFTVPQMAEFIVRQTDEPE